MSKAFCQAVKPPSPLDPPVWISQNVKLFNSERGDKYDINQALWFYEPLMQLKNYNTKQVVVYAPTGAGKSAMAEGLICWVVTQRPGPLLYLSQTNDTSRLWKETRLDYSLKNCPKVKALWPKDRHKNRKGDLIFPHMPLHIRGANKSSCQELSMQYLFGDEVWTWDAGLMTEFLNRHHKRWNRKVFLVSQAGYVDDSMDRAYEETDKNEWHFKCDGCGEYIRYEREILKYDKIKENGMLNHQLSANTARIECPECGHEYKDHVAVRRKMHENSKYIPTNNSPIDGHKGYRMHRLGIWHTPWSDYVLTELKAKKQLDMGVVDSWRQTLQKDDCQPWRDDLGIKRKDMKVSEHKLADIDPKWKMPGETHRFMTVDKGKEHFWVIIRAWSRGTASELLYEGYVESTKDEIRMREIQQRFEVQDNHVFVDIGYEQSETIDEIAPYGWWGIKGSQKPFFVHKTKVGQEEKLYSSVKIATGKTGRKARYIDVSADSVKDVLWRLMNGQGLDWRVPRDVSKAYKRHMKGEVKTEGPTGKKQLIDEYWKRIDDNHLFDCEYYNVAAALICGIFGE